MWVAKTCLTSTEFALDNRQLSFVLYVYTMAWKKNTMLHISGGVVTRLVRFYLLPFHKPSLSFVLVCSNIWSLLFTIEMVGTEMLICTIVLLPSGRSCVSTRCHWLAILKTCWHNYSITALSNACMCAVSLPSHLNSKLKQTAHSVKPTPESIEHTVKMSTACQTVRQPHQMPNGRESYDLPSGMIPWSSEVREDATAATFCR